MTANNYIYLNREYLIKLKGKYEPITPLLLKQLGFNDIHNLKVLTQHLKSISLKYYKPKEVYLELNLLLYVCVRKDTVQC